MGLFDKLKNFFFPKGTGKRSQGPKPVPVRTKAKKDKKQNRPDSLREEYMEDHSDSRDEQYDERYTRYMHNREMMSPEVIKSFNEFSQLLHNINIKMASQNDQNMALLQSLENLPAIIKDIPRARELEGDILQEILVLLRNTKEDKLKLAERMLDVKSAMMAMEENSKAQISFFEGKERAHRDQMNMMREFIEREKKHHRNNLTGIVFIVMLFVGMLCAGAFLYIREKWTAFEQEYKYRLLPAIDRIQMPVNTPLVQPVPDNRSFKQTNPVNEKNEPVPKPADIQPEPDTSESAGEEKDPSSENVSEKDDKKAPEPEKDEKKTPVPFE